MANQRQRFGLRKLSIGVASVLLGTSFVFAGGHVQASDEPAAAADQAGANQEQPAPVANDVSAQQVTLSNDHQGATAPSSDQSNAGNGQNSPAVLKNGGVASVQAAADQQNNGEVTTTYYDKFTNKPLRWMSSEDGNYNSSSYFQFGTDYVGKTIGDYINEHGIYCLNTLIPQISGYKYTGDLNALKQTIITGDGQVINLEYTRLAPIYVRYIDEDNKKVLAVLNFHVPQVALAQNFADPKATPGDTFLAKPVDPSAYTEIGDNYQANIPGYTYTGQHSPVTSGEITQTQISSTDPNPLYIDFYYKVADPVVAKYTREHPEMGHAPRFDMGPIFGFIGDKFDYNLANQKLKDYLTDNGVAYVGGVAVYDSYLNETANAPYFYFLGNMDVKVNYINEATGQVLASVSATPVRQSTQQNKNPYFGDWTSEQKNFDGLVFDRVDRSTAGKYGIFAQEVNYYYLPIVTPHTETKTVKRIIHFVADNAGHDQLQEPQTQQVTYTTTYYTDQDGKLVNAKQVTDASGNVVYVVDPNNTTTPQKVWVVDGSSLSGATLKDGQASYNPVHQDQINIQNGRLKGQWLIEKATKDSVDGTLLSTNYAPEEALANDIADGTVDNVYLIYHLVVNQPTTPGEPTSPAESPVAPASAHQPVRSEQAAAASSQPVATAQNGTTQAHQLPQTGSTNQAGLLGLGLASLLASLGLGWGSRKKRNEE